MKWSWANQIFTHLLLVYQYTFRLNLNTWFVHDYFLIKKKVHVGYSKETTDFVRTVSQQIVDEYINCYNGNDYVIATYLYFSYYQLMLHEVTSYINYEY